MYYTNEKKYIPIMKRVYPNEKVYPLMKKYTPLNYGTNIAPYK